MTEETTADGVYTGTSDAWFKPPLDGRSRCLKANTHDAGVVLLTEGGA